MNAIQQIRRCPAGLVFIFISAALWLQAGAIEQSPNILGFQYP